MQTQSLDETRLEILSYEELLANRLARQVMEKPVPPIWMILIPVFFVFYAWKLKDYSRGLKNFVANYLIAREKALELAVDSIVNNIEPEIDQLIQDTDNLPENTRPFYREWITLLISHYRFLLLSHGDNIGELIRSHYRSKESFLLATNRMVRAENAFNKALLPSIEGDTEDIRYIAGRIERFSAELYRNEVDRLFS